MEVELIKVQVQVFLGKLDVVFQISGKQLTCLSRNLIMTACGSSR